MDGVAATRSYPPTMVNPNRLSPHNQHPVNNILRTPSYNTQDTLPPGNERLQNSSFASVDLGGQLLTVQAQDVQQAGNSEVLGDKVAIHQHPLFDLLKKFFGKCEIATHSIESINCQGFDLEVKADMFKSPTSFFTENTEVDGLMLKTLQVLRIHLLELEKVNELCKDFCNRYIACLKGKLNSENLMRTLNVQSNSPTPDDNTLVSSMQQPPVEFPSQPAFVAVQSPPAPQVVVPRPVAPSTLTLPTMTVPVTPIPALPSKTSTPDSCSSASDLGILPVSVSQETSFPFGTPPSSSLNDIGTSDNDKRNLKNKRGILPKQATNVMKAWLFQHLVHPYPTEDEKRQIASQTNLTILQVNNWFINARRRILQPMLDGNSPYSARAKKLKPQKCPAQKAWPDSIGIYPYQYDANEQLQYHAVPSSVAGAYTVVSPGLGPQAGPMIVNVGQGQQTVTQPVQLVQVSGLPTVVQGVPAGSIIQVAPASHNPQVIAPGTTQGLAVISPARTPQLNTSNEGTAIIVQSDGLITTSGGV